MCPHACSGRKLDNQLSLHLSAASGGFFKGYTPAPKRGPSCQDLSGKTQFLNSSFRSDTTHTYAYYIYIYSATLVAAIASPKAMA